MRLRRLSSAFLVLWLGAAAPVWAVTIGLDPAATSVPSGTVFGVNLVVGGLSPAGGSALGGFDLDVGFDPVVVKFKSLSFGSLLGTEGLGEAVTGFDDSTPGSVNLFEVSLLTDEEL